MHYTAQNIQLLQHLTNLQCYYTHTNAYPKMDFKGT